jgi:DNA-binding cell septation regulator SpoVG
MKALHQIEVTKITRLPSGGSLKAFVSILLDTVIAINDFKIVHQSGKTPWLAMPSREVEYQGVKKYYPTIEIRDKELKSQIEQAVFRAWEQDNQTGK